MFTKESSCLKNFINHAIEAVSRINQYLVFRLHRLLRFEFAVKLVYIMDKNAQLPIIYLLSKMCKLITMRLDQSNYIAWFFQLETMLQGLDLMSYVDGSCSSTAFAKDYQEWNKNDKAVLSLISATICDEALSYLVGSSSSRDAWLRLRNKYSAVSSFDVMQLKTDLHTLRKNADSVDIYLQRVKGIRDQLAFVDVHYTDEDIIFLALNGLPPEYNNIKVVVRAMDKCISMQKFRSLLLDTERDFKKLMVHQTQSAVFAHTESTSSFNEKSSTVGNYCNNSSTGCYNIKPANLSDNGAFSGTLAYRNFRNNGNRSFRQNKKRDNGGRKYHKSVSNDFNTGANVIPECQICLKRGHSAAICYWRNVNNSASIVHCQFCGKRGHIALDCHHRLNYTLKEIGSPSSTLTAPVAQNTSGANFSCASTTAYTNSPCPSSAASHNMMSVLNPGQLQVIHPICSLGNSCHTHIGVSPTVVDGGEQNVINTCFNDNDDSDSCGNVNSCGDNFDGICFVGKDTSEIQCLDQVSNGSKSLGCETNKFTGLFNDKQADFVYVTVGNDNSVNTIGDEDLIWESQNELEKVVDDVTSFDSEDVKFCDGQQQLEKSGDDNNSVNTDSDEDIYDESKPQLKKPADTIDHVCGDDYYEFSDKKKANDAIDMNDVTIEYGLLFFLAKTQCKFSSVDIEDIICSLVNKQYAVLSKIYYEPKSVLTLAFEPCVPVFLENFQLVCAFSLPDQLIICLDIYSSRTSSLKRSKTECGVTDALLLTGHGLFLKAMVFWVILAGIMFKSSLHLLEPSDKNDIKNEDYRHGVFVCHEKYAKNLIQRASLDTSRACSSFYLSHAQNLKIEGTILCDHIFYRFIVALVVFSNTWLPFFSTLACAIKRTFYAAVFCSTQSYILSLVSQVLPSRNSTNLSLVPSLRLRGGVDVVSNLLIWS